MISRNIALHAGFSIFFGILHTAVSNAVVWYVRLKDLTLDENVLVEKMHGLAPSYFAFNTQDRRALFTLVDERKLLTMADDARKQSMTRLPMQNSF